MSLPAIEHATLIRANADRVFEVLTTASGWDAWFTNGTTLDAREGGDLRFVWRGWGPDNVNAEDYGAILVVEPSSRFAFTWHPDGPDYATTAEFTLTPDERGTVVRLRESGYHDTESGRYAILNCATGWGEALTLLKFYIERGVTY